jgi:hypothetical protein
MSMRQNSRKTQPKTQFPHPPNSSFASGKLEFWVWGNSSFGCGETRVLGSRLRGGRNGLVTPVGISAEWLLFYWPRPLPRLCCAYGCLVYRLHTARGHRSKARTLPPGSRNTQPHAPTMVRHTLALRRLSSLVVCARGECSWKTAAHGAVSTRDGSWSSPETHMHALTGQTQEEIRSKLTKRRG